MPTEARLGVDREAARLAHEVKRDMSAFEQADLTLSDAIRRLVAWWRGEPTPGRTDQLDGHADDTGSEAMST